MTTSSKFFKASFCNTLDPSAVEVLSPEQKAKQRGSLSINEGYFSDIFNVQQSSYSSFTTKSIICEDLPDREIGGLIEDVTIQGRDTKSNNSGERQEPEATIALICLPLYVLFFSAGARCFFARSFIIAARAAFCSSVASFGSLGGGS